MDKNKMTETEKKIYQIKNSNIEKMKEYLKKQESNDTRKH